MYELRKFLLRFLVFKRWFARRWLARLQAGNVRQNADVEHDLVRLGRPVIGVLESRLSDPAPLVRLTVLRALYGIDAQAARPHAERLADDKNALVAEGARRILELLDSATKSA